MTGRDPRAPLAPDMLSCYRIALYLALPLIALRLLLRALRDRRYFDRLPQRFGFGGIRPAPGGIWIHAVSVGEVNAAAPLIRHLLAQHPRRAITVTTMTPTGADRVAQMFADRVAHCYLPYDYPGATRRFLRALRPCLALVMETEIWPNLIHRCHRIGVPMIYVNARLSRRSHRGYRRFRGLIAPTLAQVGGFTVHARRDARRLLRLGASASSLTVTGSIKFDIAAPSAARARAVRRDWGEARAVWLAGSTHEGEEAQVLDAFARLRREFASLLLVIAPRHPQRFAAVAKLCARRGHVVALRTEMNERALDDDTEVYLADTMGELPTLIAASDVAFIGGSLAPRGGHNVLEASAAGTPVVFGPHMFNFAEIADLLLRRAAALQVMDANELAEVVGKLLRDDALRAQYAARGKALVERNRGALEKVCAVVESELAAIARADSLR
ncbi:MAG: lipid IV(A) 3-deoxy-D-manno-octulosonic acid transferase [bacterium]